jgi:hypothetical protein
MNVNTIIFSLLSVLGLVSSAVVPNNALILAREVTHAERDFALTLRDPHPPKVIAM